MRRFLVLLALVIPASASAAPQPLTRVNERTGFALAGEAALVSRPSGRVLQVFAHPLDGSAARMVFSVDPPPGLEPDGRRLAASAQRAAITVTWGELSDNVEVVQAFGGPPGGPWTAFGPLSAPDAVFPWGHQVDGDRLFSTESRGGLLDLAVVARDPDPHDVAFAAPEDALFAVFAGDLVAHTSGKALVVREWRTGVERSRVKLPGDAEGIALRPDGRVAVTTENDRLYELRGGKLRLLSRDARRPLAYAGDRLLFTDSDDQPRVIAPSGRVRRFGPPTETFGGFVTEGERVLWVANGCLLVDKATAAPSAAPGKGPCPRSELALDDSGGNPRLGRTIPVGLRCIAAPRVCRGTVRLSAGEPLRAISRPVRFAIRAGKRGRLRVRLTDSGYRRLREQVADEEDASVAVTTRGLRAGLLVVP